MNERETTFRKKFLRRSKRHLEDILDKEEDPNLPLYVFDRMHTTAYNYNNNTDLGITFFLKTHHFKIKFYKQRLGCVISNEERKSRSERMKKYSADKRRYCK